MGIMCIFVLSEREKERERERERERDVELRAQLNLPYVCTAISSHPERESLDFGLSFKHGESL